MKKLYPLALVLGLGLTAVGCTPPVSTKIKIIAFDKQRNW